MAPGFGLDWILSTQSMSYVESAGASDAELGGQVDLAGSLASLIGQSRGQKVGFLHRSSSGVTN